MRVFQNPWLADGRTSGVITGATNLNPTCKHYKPLNVLGKQVLTCDFQPKSGKEAEESDYGKAFGFPI